MSQHFVDPPPTRRQLLEKAGMGFAMLGFGQMLAENGLLAGDGKGSHPLAPKAPHSPPSRPH